jgi:hypothetical protein
MQFQARKVCGVSFVGLSRRAFRLRSGLPPFPPGQPRAASAVRLSYRRGALHSRDCGTAWQLFVSEAAYPHGN